MAAGERSPEFGIYRPAGPSGVRRLPAPRFVSSTGRAPPVDVEAQPYILSFTADAVGLAARTPRADCGSEPGTAGLGSPFRQCKRCALEAVVVNPKNTLRSYNGRTVVRSHRDIVTDVHVQKNLKWSHEKLLSKDFFHSCGKFMKHGRFFWLCSRLKRSFVHPISSDTVEGNSNTDKYSVSQPCSRTHCPQ